METKEHQGFCAEGHGQGHKGRMSRRGALRQLEGGGEVWCSGGHTLSGRAGTCDRGSCHQEKYILYLKGKGTYTGFLFKIFIKCTEGILAFCR